jgi:hypothetical protein
VNGDLAATSVGRSPARRAASTATTACRDRSCASPVSRWRRRQQPTGRDVPRQLPLAIPGLVTVLIFTFIAAWNEFIVALTLTTGSAVMPLTVRLYSFIGQYTVDWQHLFGASVVATIPVLILFALIERRVVGGLTAGSLK